MSVAIEPAKPEKNKRVELPSKSTESLIKYSERVWERRRSEIVQEMVADIRERKRFKEEP